MSIVILGLGWPETSEREIRGTVTVSLKVTVISMVSPVAYPTLESGDDVISTPVTYGRIASTLNSESAVSAAWVRTAGLPAVSRSHPVPYLDGTSGYGRTVSIVVA